MKKLFLLSLCLLLLSSCSIAYAHPGRTDGSGGHYNRSTGDYHYHHGYSEHEHYDMDGDGEPDCPFNFEDKTDHSNKGSSSNYSGNNSNSFTPLKSVPSPENKPEESNFFDEIKRFFSDFDSVWDWLLFIIFGIPFLLYLIYLAIILAFTLIYHIISFVKCIFSAVFDSIFKKE